MGRGRKAGKVRKARKARKERIEPARLDPKGRYHP